MNKSESKELMADAADVADVLVDANKRPSARRATSESELPLKQAQEQERTGAVPKRVRARRPSQPAADARSVGIVLGASPEIQQLDAPSEGIEFAPSSTLDSQESPAAVATQSSAPPAPRVRARRPRASQQAKPRDARSPSSTPAPRLPHSQPTAASEPSPQSDISELVPASAAVEALEASDSLSVQLHRADIAIDEQDFQPPSLEHADFSDDFGLDAQYESKLRPWVDSLCERHFHVELHGAENIPAHGRALMVANHSRTSVWDGIVLRAAMRAHHPAGRMPRWLVDDQQFHAPFLGTFVNRLGAVRACQENAERLLLREELLAVFPEGSKATQRPYEERYRLQRFGRGGYVKLALRTGTPVFPVAIVATEYEGAVWRNRLVSASRLLASPFAALRPLRLGLGPELPRIGTLPPISARIRIYVGAAVAEISRQDASATRDDGLVHELNECVRSAIQQLVNSSLHA